MSERAKAAGLLAGFLLLLGIVGRTEFEALPECGLIREEAEWIERSCLTEAETAERLDMIRRTKGGDRFDGNR